MSTVSTSLPATDPALTFLREKQVLARIPISRATWWRWIKTGRAPAPIKLGPVITVWRVSDIDALAASFGAGDGTPGAEVQR